MSIKSLSAVIRTEVKSRKSMRDFVLGRYFHQQYLHKNPNGYCGLAGCGVTYR